jgi:hypothetical protein
MAGQKSKKMKLNIFWIFAMIACNNLSNRNHPKSYQDQIFQSIRSSSIDTTTLKHTNSTVKLKAFTNPLGIISVSWEADSHIHFTLWNRNLIPVKLMFHDSIPRIMYLNDTIGLFNLDRYQDLLVQGQYVNGKYQNGFARLYCYNGAIFVKINDIEVIPNPSFNNSNVLGQETFDSLQYKYHYDWQDDFNLKLDSSKIEVGTIR